MSTLNTTLKTKAYRNYIKRTLIILKYRHLKTLIGLYLQDLNNYSDATEYRSLIRKISQYHKHCIMLPIKITLQNGQMQKLSYILIIKDASIYMLLTTVLNYVY